MASKRYRKQLVKHNFSSNPLVVGYIRVSTHKQAAEGDSLAAQKSQIEDYCNRNNLELISAYSDDGISGTKDRTGRPGLNDVLDCLENKRAYGVITPYFDRFGRGGHRTVQDVVYITEELGCRFICLDINIDTSTAAGQMMLNMMAATAKLFRDQIAEKTRDTLKSKREKGEVYSPVPMGYDRDKDLLVVNDDEQKIVKMIIRQRKKGLSYHKIADGLNRKGVSPKSGKKWHPYSCQVIYERAVYQ